MGAMPSRTSVTLTPHEGQSTTIPPANERSAGIMTAQQADQLARLWQKFGTTDAPVAANDTAQGVSVEQVQSLIDAALSAAQQQPATPAPAQSGEPQPVISIDPQARQLVAELQQRITDLGKQVEEARQRQAEPPPPPKQPEIDSHVDGLPGGLPGFLRQDTPAPQPPAPPPVDLGPILHDIANIQQSLMFLNDRIATLDKAEPEPVIDIRAQAIAAIETAGRKRRAAVVPHGDTDPALALNLATTAHLAKSGQEGAFSELARLAEAKGERLWQDVADDLIRQADSAMRVAVRSFAVETKAMAEIAHATDEQIPAIRDEAIRVIGLIEG